MAINKEIIADFILYTNQAIKELHSAPKIPSKKRNVLRIIMKVKTDRIILKAVLFDSTPGNRLLKK